MEQKIYDYRATEEIKQIVIGIQELRCRRSVEKAYAHIAQVDYVEYEKQSAKHQLLNAISDFILVREIQDGFYVEAELYLPYVRDSKIKELETTIKSQLNSIRILDADKTSLQVHITQLMRPWWKKLLRIKK